MSLCYDLVVDTLKAICSEGTKVSCAGAGAEFETICIAAGGGPEDPFADVACTAALTAFEAVCNEMGCAWISQNIDEAAKKICGETKKLTDKK